MPVHVQHHAYLISSASKATANQVRQGTDRRYKGATGSATHVNNVGLAREPVTLGEGVPSRMTHA